MRKHVIWLLLIGIAACGGKNIIRSEPPTAFVTINDVPKGVTPLEITLDCDKAKEYKIKLLALGIRHRQKQLSARH